MDNNEHWTTKFNTILAEYFSPIETKLNQNSIPYKKISLDGTTCHLWQIQSLAGVTSAQPLEGDTFRLVEHKVGVTEIEVKETDLNKFTIRRLLGNALVNRIISKNDPNFTNMQLFPIVTEMILSLEKELGYSYKDLHHGKFIHFKKIGTENEYFNLFPSKDSIELVAFSTTYPAIDIKK